MLRYFEETLYMFNNSPLSIKDKLRIAWWNIKYNFVDAPTGEE